MAARHKGYDEKKAAIVDAAWTLVAGSCCGWDGTTVDGVIAAAGVSKGTFYHYFASKDELFDALLDRVLDHATEEVNREMARVEGQDAIARFNVLRAASRKWRREHGDILREVWRALNRDENTLLRLRFLRRDHDAVFPVMADIVRQGIASGVFLPADDADEVAHLVLDFYDALGARNARDAEASEECAEAEGRAVRRVNLALGLIERMLGAPEGSLERLTAEPRGDEERAAAAAAEGNKNQVNTY
jgi:AcrR family transcriptional regulator